MELDMERTVRSGVERFCWQIMRILQDLEVLSRFCKLAVMLLRKRVGVLRYLWSMDIRKTANRHGRLLKSLVFALNRKVKCSLPWQTGKSMQWFQPVWDGFLTQSVRYLVSDVSQVLRAKHQWRWSLRQKYMNSWVLKQLKIRPEMKT